MEVRLPLQKLISHSTDLLKLWNEGIELEVHGLFLIVRNIAYLDLNKVIRRGCIVSPLSVTADNFQTVKPETHVIYFQGDAPHDKHGNKLDMLIAGEKVNVTDKISADFTFSQKPFRKQGYDDYYEKITTYINLISGPVRFIDSSISEKTFAVPLPVEDEISVFNYLDSNSSKANITFIAEKLKGYRVAIIGLGGTGSYLLDYLAKTQVMEIHLFDGDIFKTNNSFRSPGAASIEELMSRIPKVTYFENIYQNMHRGIKPHEYYLTPENIIELDGLNFIFICVDTGEVRKMIIDFLCEKSMPFIDVGIGVNIIKDKLMGTVRTTTSTLEKRDHIVSKIPFSDSKENEYKNIQIAELNSLNATFAIIKWKKLCGFYHDQENEYNSNYSVELNMLISNENKT